MSASASASAAVQHNHDHGKNLEEVMAERAMGCLIGQAVGDALGTRYEFQGSKAVKDAITHDLDQTGHLPILGGGPFRLKPGQVTDDTELALGLARSLVRTGQFDIEDIAQAYTRWMASPPFDCGITTSKAFGKTRTKQSGAENYKIIKAGAALGNQKSQSNGCLMRISPLAIAGVRWKDPTNLILASGLECELTNPNIITLDAVAVFVMAIRTAILTGDRQQVYEMAVATAGTKDVQAILERSNQPEPIILDNGTAIKTESSQYMGYFGIAMQNAFYELRHGTSFESSLVNIISRGGDTDTNGCIGGALLGALYGFSEIPSDWYQSVIHAPTQKRQKEYPDVQTDDLLVLALELLGDPDDHIREPRFAADEFESDHDISESENQ